MNSNNPMSEDNMKFIDNVNVMCKILEDVGLKFSVSVHHDSKFEYSLNFSGTFFIGDVENFKSKLRQAISSIWKLTESTNIKVNVGEPTEKNYFDRIYNVSIEYRFPMKDVLVEDFNDKTYVTGPDYLDLTQTIKNWEIFKYSVREKIGGRNMVSLMDTMYGALTPSPQQLSYLLPNEEQIKQVIWLLFTNDIQSRNNLSYIIHSKVSTTSPEIYLDLVNDKKHLDAIEKEKRLTYLQYVDNAIKHKNIKEDDEILKCSNIFQDIIDSERYTSKNIYEAIYQGSFTEEEENVNK